MDLTMESATTETKTYKEGQLIKGKDFIRLESPLVLPSKNTPLLTEAQDFVGAINELKKGLDEGGGDDTWIRPSDWPAMPEPSDNQVVMLLTTQWARSPYQQFGFYAYRRGNTAANFDGTTTAVVDWGDGFTDTVELLNTQQVAYSKQHNFYDYDDNGIWLGWHEGPVLDSGAHVFVITVTVPDNAYLWVIGSNCNCLEMYIGKNVKFYGGALEQDEMIEHVKLYGWQPSDDNHYGGKGLFYGCYTLQCVDATEPLKYIPENAFNSCFNLKEIDLSVCTEIKAYGLFKTALKKVNSEALQILNEYALGDCYVLESIIAPNLAAITSYYALHYDFNITDITIAEDCSFPTGTFVDQYRWDDNPEKDRPPS